MGAVDISTLNLFLGLLLILIPSYFLYHYKTGLLKDTLLSVVRMVIQLFMIGIYLKYLFQWNNTLINILWVAIMISIGTFTTIKRTKLPISKLFGAVSISFTISILLIMPYFLGIVVELNNIFDARYFIPITGMILGNMLTANVVALNAYYSSIKRERLLYNYLIGNGAKRSEALNPFIRQAIIKSINPTIASMAVMGLISLPGTMTGQIIGGSSPEVAIKYQIMIMIVIFAASLISVLLSLYFSRLLVKDDNLSS